MVLKIEKELFQWEKDRYVFIELEETDPKITCIQFYNQKSKYGPEIPIEEGKAKIPNYLLKESLPIMAVACIGSIGETQVVGRREFKIIKRIKPENYINDSDDPNDPDNTNKEIIYDGGVEV